MAQRKGQTTTERGLGWDHQQVRKQLLRDLVDGTPCEWCHRAMFKWQELDADHELARVNGGRKATRLLHASCNRQRKDGSKPSTSLTAARDDRAKWTLLAWWA